GPVRGERPRARPAVPAVVLPVRASGATHAFAARYPRRATIGRLAGAGRGSAVHFGFRRTSGLTRSDFRAHSGPWPRGIAGRVGWSPSTGAGAAPCSQTNTVVWRLPSLPDVRCTLLRPHRRRANAQP